MTPALSEKDVNRYVGGKIRERRLALNMTQAALAGRMGILRSSLANLEQGRQGLPAMKLAVAAAILSVRVDELLPEVDAPPAPAPPAPPHEVTIRTVHEVTCATCDGLVIGASAARKDASALRRDHIAAMREETLEPLS